MEERQGGYSVYTARGSKISVNVWGRSHHSHYFFNLLIVNSIMPSGGLMMHFLGVDFLKGYATEGTIYKLAEVDDSKTFRKWRWPFISALSYLESVVVSNSSK